MPGAALLGLAALAPLLPGLARAAGAGSSADAVIFAGLLVSLGTLAWLRLGGAGGPSPLPRTVWRWGLGFLAVSLASLALSVARGETLYLLVRGRVDPLVVNSLGMTASERTAGAIRVFLTLVMVLAAADAFARLARSADGRRGLVLAASTGAALAGLSALLGPRLGLEVVSNYWKALGRISGTFTDPNALGIGLAALLPIAAAGLVELRGPARAVPLAALLLAPAALERSGSRTALIVLGFAVAAAAVGGIRSGGRVRTAFLAAGGATLLLGAGLFLLVPRGPAGRGGLVHRLEGALTASSIGDLASSRPTFWRAAVDIVKEEPLSGCGLGGFPFEFPRLYERENRPALFTDNATNAFLDVAAESGLPALALAVGAVTPLLLLALETAFSPRPAGGWCAVGGAASVVGLFAASFTGSHLRFPEVALLAALAVAFLPLGEASGKREDRAGEGEGPKRVLPVLVAAGVLASLLATLPTRTPDAPFRGKGDSWIGVYSTEGRAAPRRWTGARIYRRVKAGEPEARVTLQNARPDGRPVLAAVWVNDVPAGSAVLPKDERRTLAVRPLPGEGAILRIAFSPTFVPARRGGNDHRRLGVLIDAGGSP